MCQRYILKELSTTQGGFQKNFFTKFSNLTLIILNETPAPYSCLFPLECAKYFGIHSIHPTEDSHTSRKRDVLVRPDQQCVVFSLNMGVQAVWGKDLHQLLWVSSRAAYGKITVCCIINRYIIRNFCITLIRFTKMDAGRVIKPGWLRFGN